MNSLFLVGFFVFAGTEIVSEVTGDDLNADSTEIVSEVTGDDLNADRAVGICTMRKLIREVYGFVMVLESKNGLFLRYNLQIPNSMNMDELSLQIHGPAPETSANRCSAFERNYYKGIHESRVLKVLIRRPYNMTDGKSIGTTPLFRYPLADLPGLIIAVHDSHNTNEDTIVGCCALIHLPKFF